MIINAEPRLAKLVKLTPGGFIGAIQFIRDFPLSFRPSNSDTILPFGERITEYEVFFSKEDLSLINHLSEKFHISPQEIVFCAMKAYCRYLDDRGILFTKVIA